MGRKDITIQDPVYAGMAVTAHNDGSISTAAFSDVTFKFTGVTGVEEIAASNIAPQGFMLSQNYPNPFNGATVIRYILPLPEQVQLYVFNIKGERVKRLADGFEEAGSHQIFLNSGNMPSGIYFYTIVAGKDIATKKLLLFK